MNIKHSERETLIHFALALYARPSIESLCLELQDDVGVQVNLLLWCAWLDADGLVLSESLLESGRRRIALQDQLLVRPLRGLRRLIPKQRYLALLRGWVKRCELQAELWQLQKLQLCRESWAVGDQVADGQLSFVSAYLLKVQGVGAVGERAETLLRQARKR